MGAKKCSKCGSPRIRLNVPPDFEAFYSCKDCGKIQKKKVD